MTIDPASPKRILYIEANEDGTVGGSHQALYDLTLGLDHREFEPVVLFYQDNQFRPLLKDYGIEVHDYEEEREHERELRQTGSTVRKYLDYFGAIVRRRRFLRQYEIDLVHINNSPRVGNDDWLPAAKSLGIPIVASVMGDAEGEPNPLRRPLFRSFDRVYPVSEWMADAMREAGIAKKKIRVIHHGVDIEKLREKASTPPASVREELGIPEDRLMVTLVANIRRWKGQHVLLKALSELPVDIRDRIHAVFVGAFSQAHQEYGDELKRLVRRLQLQDRVTFTGRREDVPDLHRATDIVVHTSTTPEPGGIAVLEALALGCPVLASDRGGHREALRDGAGRTYNVERPGELAEELKELVRSPELRAQMSRAARERIEEFSVAKNVEETSRAYRQLLDTGP